jgi:cobalt-zinc-cadmium efflux system membrane fusion protein
MKVLFKIALVVLPFITGCSSKETKTEEKAPAAMTSVKLNKDQIRNVGLIEQAPVMEPIGFTVYANGTIEVPPQNKTVITAQFGGFIKSLDVLDGMSVKKGQTLLKIEHPDLIQLQQDYLEVTGNIEYLEAELERQKKLAQGEAGSMKSMQLAKSQYNAAVAQRSGLKAKLDMAGVNMKKLNSGELQRTVAITAPFDGVVTKVSVDVGAYSDPTDHLLEIIDLKHSHAEVIVFEKDVKHLKIGQKVKLVFATDNETLDATIFLIGKEIGRDRTVKVHCHLSQENKDIAPGAYFKASIYTGEKDQYCVPDEAIVELNGKQVVFFGSDAGNGMREFKPEEVEVLGTDRSKAAIRYMNASRSYNDKLVVTGAYDLMSALLVTGEE